MSDAPFIELARIVKTHGVKGEVSVVLLTDLPFSMLEGVRVWIVPPPAAAREGVIESVRTGPKGPLVKISGIDDIDTASGLRNRILTALAADLPEWSPDQEPEVEGYEVFDAARGLLGTVRETILTGANDVWIVDGGRFGQILVPVIDDVVVDIDDDARRIEVELLPGLIDGED